MDTLTQQETTKPSLHNDRWCRSAWLDEMSELLCSAMKNQWTIGDLALRTPPEASRDEVRELLEEAAARAGYEVNSIRDLRTVAERIPPELRNRKLSWYAHKDISKLNVLENGTVSEEKSLALRAEFIERFSLYGQPSVPTWEKAVDRKTWLPCLSN